MNLTKHLWVDFYMLFFKIYMRLNILTCRAVSCAPGSAVVVVIYARVVTCGRSVGRSFTVLSGWGILISFRSVLVFFSHPPLPVIVNTLLLLSLLLLLLLVITVIIISTELLAQCDGCLGWGWVWQAGFVAGLLVGQALGSALATWVWGQQLQPPGSWAPNLYMRCRC